MPRPKYSITAEDVFHATEYLRTRLQVSAFDLGDTSHRKAKNEFDEAIATGTKVEKAEGLNAWCVKYLGVDEWTKLKTSIRKRRERKVRRGEVESVTISKKAFELLQKLSKRDNVTYSETLEKYLGKAWRA